MTDDPRIPEVVTDMEKELGEGNKKPEILPKLAQYELTLLDWVEAHRGLSQICGHRRKMLACIPDPVWLCALLCQQPSDRQRHPRILRGRYLRRSQRVHRNLRQPGCRYSAGYQQHRSGRYVRKRASRANSTTHSKDTFMGFHCGNTCSRKAGLLLT